MFTVAVIHDVEHQCDWGVLRWAYATRSYCLKKYAPPDFEVSRWSDADIKKRGWRAFKDYDLVFIIDYTQIGWYTQELRRVGMDGVVVSSFNKDHRSRLDDWAKVLKDKQFLIINNVDRYEHDGIQPRTCCISNGLDLQHWKVTTPFNERPERAIWCGGVGKKKKKGYAEIMQPLQPLLEAEGIECDFRPVHDIVPQQVLTPDEQLDWYNGARYVICASETEGTPGFLLEGMACGCLPVTTWVGNVPEIFTAPSKNVVLPGERRPEVFCDKLLAMRDSANDRSRALSDHIRRKWGYGEPANRADHFFALFRALIRRGVEGVEPFCHWDVKPGDI